VGETGRGREVAARVEDSSCSAAFASRTGENAGGSGDGSVDEGVERENAGVR